MTKRRDYDTVEEMLVRLFKDAGGEKRMAALLDLGLSYVYSFHDPQSPAAISFAQVLKITSFTGATAAAEMLATAAGGVFLPPVPRSAPDDLARIITNTVNESGDLVTVLVTALSKASPGGGALTHDEKCAALREADELLRAAAEARAVIARTDIVEGRA